MSYWIDDPQLFLYAKGTGPDDVLLRRCKKPMSSSSSSLVVPMKSDDFEYASDVKNYRLLIGDEFDWDEPGYKRLVKYIYERALLVNRQGLVIAEIYKLDDANLVVPIYIRSLDVLRLKPYIPNIRERPIPLRTVKYLEDVNGKAAMMEDDVITKLTARVENLEAENTKLESKNNTLDASVTQLTVDLVTQMNALTTLQQELKKIYANTKEVWMNDLTNSEWVGIEALLGDGPFKKFEFTVDDIAGVEIDVHIVGQLGTSTVDESSTNVRARYWYTVHLKTPGSNICSCKAISLEDLTSNKERARFSQGIWFAFKSKGKTYVYHGW